MLLLKLAHPVYVTVRNVLDAAGLSKPLRFLVGPTAGRLISKMAVNAGEPVLVQGHRMFLTSPHGYPPVAMATDKYEEESTQLFQRLLKPGMNVFDAGSHVGYYSLLAARQVGPEGKVYAFEPEPDNYALLLKNIELNGYANISATRKALTNQVGSTTLFLTGLDNGRHSIYHHGLPEKGSVDVESTTVDAVMEANGWPTIDLFKADVEGSELDLLEGMEQFLERSPQLNLIIEFSPSLLRNAGADPLRLLEMLATRRFKVQRIIEREGGVPLREEDWPSFVEGLSKAGQSENLFCSRQ